MKAFILLIGYNINKVIMKGNKILTLCRHFINLASVANLAGMDAPLK